VSAPLGRSRGLLLTGALLSALLAGWPGAHPTSADTSLVNWGQSAMGGPAARCFQGMAYDSARGRTVIFGGANASSYFGDTWEWDGSIWQQLATTGQAPPARALAAMVYDSRRGRTVLFGGANNSTDFGDTW